MEPFQIKHETKDIEILSYIQNQVTKGEDYHQIIEQILSVGVAVLQRVQSSRDVEFVKKETEKLMNNFQTTVAKLETEISDKVEQQISTLFNPEVEDSYTKKFGTFLNQNLDLFRKDIKTDITGAKEISNLLIKSTSELNEQKMAKIETGIKTAEQNFNPELETSYFGKIKSIVTDVNSNLQNQLDDQKVGSFAYRLREDAGNLFGEDSPIIKTIQEIIDTKTKEFNDNIIKLREEIAKEQGKDEGAKEAMEKSALKGKTYEQELMDDLEDIAVMFGDRVEFTGDMTEDGTKNKKGDFIYTLNTGQRVIIEAKDRELGLTPSLRYLDKAMSNRGISFSLLIYKHATQLPKQTGPFNFYEDNKVLSCKEYLRFAIQWCRIYLNKAENQLAEGVNKTMVLQRVKDIQTRFKDISNVKNKLTQMRNSVNMNADSVKEILDRLKDDVFEYVDEIENEFLVSGSKSDVDGFTSETENKQATTEVFDLPEESESISNTSDKLLF